MTGREVYMQSEMEYEARAELIYLRKRIEGHAAIIGDACYEKTGGFNNESWCNGYRQAIAEVLAIFDEEVA